MKEAIGQTINIGNGRATSIMDLAHEVANVVGLPEIPVIHDNPRPGDVLGIFYADNSKAKKLLHFEPKVTLHDGLTKLRDWYLSLEQSPETLLNKEILHNWDAEEVKKNA